MRGILRARLFAPTLCGVVALATALMPAMLCAGQRAHAAPIYLTVSSPYNTITPNFNIFSQARDPFALGAIYEPLIVITEPPAAPHTYPWLAAGYRWTNGNRSLVVTLRSGVRWSDGRPFTAGDVVFTYTYGRRHAVADQQGLWSGKVLRSVSARGNQVTFNLTGADSTALPRILSKVFIYLYAATTPVGLYFNDEQYPFSLPGFRKALSHAIDRQSISRIAEYGYELPADALGLAQPYPSWVDRRLEAQARDMVTHDIPRARSMLAQAGFALKGGQLHDPRGAAVSITLAVISDWSDWVLAMQITERDLRKLGIDTSVKLMTAANWFDQETKGELSADLNWVNGGSTPYYMYDGFMSKESYTPTGTDATLNGGSNWARYYDPEATRLLAQFRQTTDGARQHTAIDRIEAIFLRDLPWIPVMYGADWYTYSTRHFTGFPTKDDLYADGSPNNDYERVVVLTHLKPVE
jgi:ABC-type transport system substrate-binding protein